MTPEARVKVKEMLIDEESFSQYVYPDINGYLTIGYGRSIDHRIGRGISNSEALQLLDNDIFYFTNKLLQFYPYFSQLNDARQVVLVNLCFNLGIKGLLGFDKMLKAITDSRWDDAEAELLNSDAAKQLPNRYRKLGAILREGII